MGHKFSKSAALLALLVTAVTIGASHVSRAAATNVLVGAIRWDAWQENGDIQATVARTGGVWT